MATPWLHVPTFRIAIPPSDLYYTCTGGWRRMRDRTPSSCESMCSCQSFHVRVRRVSMYTLKGRMCKKGTWKFLSPCVSRAQKRRGKFWLNKYSPSFFFLPNLFSSYSRNKSPRQDKETNRTRLFFKAYTTFPITYFSMASCLAACSLKYTSIKFLVYYKFLLGLIELLSILLKSGANHVNVTNRPRRTKFFRRHQTHTHTTFFDSGRLRLQSRAKGGGPLDTVPLDKVLFIQLVRKHDRS